MPVGDINNQGIQFFPIPVFEGGIGVSNVPLNALMVGNGSKCITTIDGGSDGQVLIGKSNGIAAFATLTSTDASVTFTPGANSLDLSASGGGGGITWSEETGTSATMAVDNGYIANNVALVTLTLPTTAAVGSVVRVAGKGAGGWKISQNASEIIHFGTTDTTTGVGGSLASTERYDAVELVCIVADTEWVVLSSLGNITIV